ncbi:hypothetical protein BJ165DRAFT_1513537 [Panaeolus papilionaceus]|nr:hypothetical protein BJ165DRAFT_1513537 [Panaeolus papilionaceus]
MNDDSHGQSPAKKRKLSETAERHNAIGNAGPSQTQREEETVKRVNDLWFDDGSVVLQAGLSQFRVHRAVLSRCSSIFKDMFSIPQPTSETGDRIDDYVEGCPVIHLQDTAEDVTILLTAIYDHGKYDSMHKIRFKEVSALLRLGSKYDISSLRDNALQRLRAEFPTTLDEWDRLDVEYKTMSDSVDICLFDVITLAYNEGILSILPVLYYFYLCDGASLAPSQIFYGIERSDGTKATLPFILQRDIILGREELMSKARLHPFKWLRDEPGVVDCYKPKGCRAIRNKLIESSWLAPDPVGFPFDKWSDRITDEDLSQLCLDCKADAEIAHEGREELWNLLPTLFNLPEWEELKRMDRG